MQHKLLFFEDRRLTATQAKDCGLIQDVFLPDNFEKEVVLRACKIASEFTQVWFGFTFFTSFMACRRLDRLALNSGALRREFAFDFQWYTRCLVGTDSKGRLKKCRL